MLVGPLCHLFRAILVDHPKLRIYLMTSQYFCLHRLMLKDQRDLQPEILLKFGRCKYISTAVFNFSAVLNSMYLEGKYQND